MIRIVAFFLLTPALALADFAEDFQKTRGTKDHAAMVKLLDVAAKTEADNPDYYALASNYWWSFAGEINLSTKPAADGEPSIRDKDSGEEVGSISTNGDLDPSLRKKADAIAVYEKIIKLEPEGQAAAAAKEALEEVGEEKK